MNASVSNALAAEMLAMGKAAPDARQFTLTAERGSSEYGICSNPFLEKNFRTDSFTITITVFIACT